MKGYVQNTSNQAFFILQRQILPGGKVNLDDAYKTCGKKSGLDAGPEFVEWLQQNILTRGSWSFYESEGKLFGGKKSVKKKVEASDKTSSNKVKDAKGAGRVLRRDAKAVKKGNEITPRAIIEAPIEQARALIEKCKDKSVLKKALSASQNLSEKSAHMRHLMRRLEQVY